jgi:iron(III) transport system permease protein
VSASRQRWWQDPWNGVTAGGFGLALLLLIVPVFGVFRTSFLDADHQLSLANYRELFANTYYRDAFINSLVVSVGGTLGAILLGVPLALLVTRFVIPGKRLLKTFAVLSLLSPPFIGAYAWILILGNNGFLRRWLADVLGLGVPTIYGPFGIMLVYALQFYPLVFLLTASGLQTVDRSLEEAAECFGATGLRKLFRVTLPLVLPSLSAGALMAFMLSLANFGTPMILGGTYRVLPTLAYNKFTSEVDENPGLAATLCIVLVLVSVGAVLFQRWLSSRRKVVATLTRRTEPQRLEGWRHALATAASYGIVAMSTFPLVVIATYSFRKTNGPVFQAGFDFGSYQQVFHRVPRAISNSLAFSLLAVALIVIVGMLVGYVVSRRRTLATRLLDPTLMTAYVVPGIVLGIGFVVAFNRLPFPLLGGGMVLVLVYFIRRLPYTVRSSAAILDQIDPVIEEAAMSLGAAPAEAFRRVTLPLMIPGVVAGAVLSWVTAINELSASIVLYEGHTVTMPISIYQCVVDGSYGPAAALSTLLVVATGVAIFVVNTLVEVDEAVAG